MSKRIFKVILIKPSHYDHRGYVIQWWRSTIPSNSLASVHGILTICAQTHALGLDVEIDVEAYDECNTIIDVKGAIGRIREAGSGFVGLVGVQSNQFPRAVDLARQFRAVGLPVVIGGFHVSGLLAMLPEPTADLKEALALGVTFFAGEAEGRMAALLRDIDEGKMRPIYNYLGDAPGMEAAALPMLPKEVIARVAGNYTSFDAGRGCPFQCSFCTIINVQGRKSRYRTADDVEAIVRANMARGIWRFFVTDDNFARNKNWEPILDRLIQLREQGMRIHLLLQVDTLCHHTPGFIEKAAKAGCNAVFIGLENINPESLMGAKKRQNKIWEYREMLQAWRAQKVMTWAGYILGFPTDTPETIARDIEIIKRELPIDILEFFCLTPLPGSEDHKNLATRGVAMDPDMNIRPRECLHQPSHHVGRDMGAGLSRRLEALLHPRPCRDCAAPRASQWAEHEQGRHCADHLFRLALDRGRAPAAIRAGPAQGPPPAAFWAGDRESSPVLSTAGGRGDADGASMVRAVPPLSPDQEAGPGRCGRCCLFGPGLAGVERCRRFRRKDLCRQDSRYLWGARQARRRRRASIAGRQVLSP
jgi:pyruvate-formate lyase-activating enzyme